MSGYAPVGAVHGFENVGDEVYRVIAVMSPGGSEAFFAAGAQHGFEFFGPLPELAKAGASRPWRLLSYRT